MNISRTKLKKIIKEEFDRSRNEEALLIALEGVLRGTDAASGNGDVAIVGDKAVHPAVHLIAKQVGELAQRQNRDLSDQSAEELGEQAFQILSQAIAQYIGV